MVLEEILKQKQLEMMKNPEKEELVYHLENQPFNSSELHIPEGMGGLFLNANEDVLLAMEQAQMEELLQLERENEMYYQQNEE